MMPAPLGISLSPLLLRPGHEQQVLWCIKIGRIHIEIAQAQSDEPTASVIALPLAGESVTVIKTVEQI